MEFVLVLIIFLAALGYLISVFYRTFATEEGGCSGGCSGCGTVDFKKIESQIKKDREINERT